MSLISCGSVGDVIALIQIGLLVAKKLKAAAIDAPEEICELMDNVETLRGVLKSTRAALDANGGLIRRHKDVKINLASAFAACRRTLGLLEEVVTEYESVVKKRGNSLSKQQIWAETFKNCCRRLKWTTMDETIKRLNQRMNQHIHILQVAISSLTALDVQNLQRGLDHLIAQLHKHGELIQTVLDTPTLRPTVQAPTGHRDSGYSETFSLPTPAIPPDASPYVASIEAFGEYFAVPKTGEISRNPVHVRTPSVSISPGSSPVLASTTTFESQIEFGPPPALDLVHFLKTETANRSDGSIRRRSSIASVYQRQATISQHREFVDRIRSDSTCIELPVTSVQFIHRKKSHKACGEGTIIIVKSGEGPAQAVSDIWIFNNTRTMRIQQKLPTWDEVIPYTIHGIVDKAVIEQGEALNFYSPNNEQRELLTIPTSWVEYSFRDSDHCKLFQETVFGMELLLTAACSGIYQSLTFRSNKQLTPPLENIRLWKHPQERRSSEVRFIVRLLGSEKSRPYLDFDITSGEVDLVDSEKGVRKLRLKGLDLEMHNSNTSNKADTKHINKIEIEFSSREDKRNFRKAFYQCQQ